MPTSMTVRRSLALAVAALLIGAGCGVETSSEGVALSTPTSVQGGDPSPPTGADGGGPTTTAAPDEEVTAEDLEAILPDAADIGAAYHELSDNDADDDDEGSDPVQDAIDEQCPDMVTYQDDEDEDKVNRTYQDTQGRQISVSLKPSTTVKDDADLADYIDTVNACGPVEASNGDIDYELEFEAEEVPDLGEQAVRIRLAVTVDSPDLSSPLTVYTYGVNFRLQDVGVQVAGSDGTNGEQRVAFDEPRLDPVVSDVEARVKDLLD